MHVGIAGVAFACLPDFDAGLASGSPCSKRTRGGNLQQERRTSIQLGADAPSVESLEVGGGSGKTACTFSKRPVIRRTWITACPSPADRSAECRYRPVWQRRIATPLAEQEIAETLSLPVLHSRLESVLLQLRVHPRFHP